MAPPKLFTVQIFAPDGTTYRKSLAPGVIKNAPTFRDRINSGLGECVLDLNLPFDDFDEGNSVALMNVVDISSVDEAHPRGRRIYRGFLSAYEPYIDSGQGVRLTCLGLGSLLTHIFFKSGGSFTVSRGPEDPTVTAKAIIDYFDTFYPGLITYDISSIPATVGTNISFAFADYKCFDALKKTGELSGAGWWWHIDADGKLQLKAKPTSATHRLAIGREIQSITATKTGEKIANDIQVRRSGGTATDYSDSTSITAYGLRSQIVNDSSISDATTANQRGGKLIADGKDPKVSARIVLNEQADIDAIKVGDTVEILNLKKGTTFFSTNSQIVSTTYKGTELEIELEQITNDFGAELETFVG
jgi:hypothetical protein